MHLLGTILTGDESTFGALVSIVYIYIAYSEYFWQQDSVCRIESK